MKKFKVGDWVKCQVTEDYAEIHRIAEIKGKMIGGEKVFYCFNSQGLSFFESELTKLNIHFKHFNIVLKSDGAREVWDSMRKIRGFGRVHLICMKEASDIFIGYKIPHRRILSTHVQTVEQAEAWLELQHARTLVESKDATK